MPIIKLNSELGKRVGFVSDLFHSGSYLWEEGKVIIISLIMSKNPGNGNFSRLLKAITEAGYYIEVPTPFPMMEKILRKKGFIMKSKYLEDVGDMLEYMTNRKEIS